MGIFFPCYADTIYVSLSGSDTNEGSQGKPLKTITKAVEKATAGSTILIAGGEYRERIKITKSGTALKRIIIRGESSNTIINAGVRLTSWNADQSSNVYTASFPSFEVGNVTLNNRYIAPVESSKIASAIEKEFITGPYGSWNPAEGIFGYINKTLYFGFNQSINITTNIIDVSPRNEGSFTLDGASYITLENLTFKNGYYGVYLLNGAHHNTVSQTSITGNSYGIGLGKGAEFNAIENNNFSQQYAVSMSPYTNYATELWDVFKVLGTGDKVAIDCYLGGSNNSISNNTINGYFGGIYLGRGSDSACVKSSISNNFIENIADDALEQEGNGTGNAWFSNTVKNAKQGIRLKELINGPIYIYNNIVVDSQNRGIYYVASKNAQVFAYHNSFINTPTKMMVATKLDGGDFSNSVFINNLFIGNEFGQLTNTGNGVNFQSNGIITQETGVLPVNDTNKVVRENNVESKYSLSTPQVPIFEGVGIDISKTFVINGKQYPPLPGFTNGYFLGSKPNVGSYLKKSTSLNCPTKQSGDANCDKEINIIDFELWRKEVNGTSDTKNADFNGNNIIEIIDFEIWRRNAISFNL